MIDPTLPYKRCPTCETLKQVTEFRRNVARRDGLSTQCKECGRAMNKKWRRENKEYVKAYNHAYFAAISAENRARGLDPHTPEPENNL